MDLDGGGLIAASFRVAASGCCFLSLSFAFSAGISVFFSPDASGGPMTQKKNNVSLIS